MFLIVLFANVVTAQDFLKEKSGIDFAEEGNLEAAIKTFEKLAEKEPDNARYLYELGTAYLMDKKYDKAAEYLSKAAAGEDTDIKEKALYNLGNAFFRNNKFSEALNSYKNALKLNSENKEARENLEMPLAKLPRQKQEQKQSNQNQNQENQKNKNDRQQQNKDKNSSDKQKEKEEQKNRQDKQQDEKSKKNEEQQQNKESETKQRQQQKQQQQQQQQNSEDKKQQQMKKISKEAALQLLNALEQEEKNSKIKLRPIQSKGVKRDKDW
jgi:tetratricopeptide (TPR) repeat protein